jgi:heterodisulfide reductase subunit C/nitrate reductase gamma subunit
MIYDTALYGALTIFGVGLIYKVSGWFRFSVEMQSRDGATPAPSRIPTALKGVFTTLLSPKLSKLARVFVSDVLVQMRIRNEDFVRWLMHILIFAGFTFLFFTHALDKIILTSLYDRYYLDLNPFLIVAGLMVLAGVAIAAYRRFIRKVPRLKTAGPDYYALIILAVIIISGLAMELTKLTSYENWQTYWNIHVYGCLFGLAYLPFSKMLHVLTTPVSLLANAVMDRTSNPANIKTRQMMELDACTRCGTCSNRCSVAVAFDRIGNELILPSERMEFLKDYYSDKTIGAKGLSAIGQGIYLCTNCDRCTVACPAGINLREMWFDVREEIIQRGDAVPLVLTPFSYFRGLNMDKFDLEPFEKPVTKAREKVTAPYQLLHRSDDVIPLTSANEAFKESTGLSDRASTYAYCFTCENCTTVCPVVGNYDSPAQELDMLPHQIMRSMGFGIKDLAMGSRMLWYCLTCYQCQEHCPQGVKVADVLYELKNLAAKEAIPSQPVKGSV